MQKIKAWCGKNFRWILSIIVVFLWIGILCYKEPIFCFLSDDLYKERNTIIIWIAIIFIFFWVGIWTWKKNTLFSRASILIIIAFTGLFLVLFREDIFNFFFFDFKNGEPDNFTKDSKNFITLLLGSLIFLTLWFFRTYDVREQIGQQDFHDALRMLADDKLISQEIAVIRLIDISKKTKVYDDTIKLAFIKRMKSPYKEIREAIDKREKLHIKLTNKTNIRRYFFGRELGAFETKVIVILSQEKEKYFSYFEKSSIYFHNITETKISKKLEKRSYAQYIFLWILERYTRDNLGNTLHLDLRNQIFFSEDKAGNKINYFKDKKGHSIWLYSNLAYSYLSGVDLKEVFLTKANLVAVDLTGADLTDAFLVGANLRDADLRYADLTGADLRDADLRDADLRLVNGLTYEQLVSVKSLFGAKELATALKPEELTRLKAEIPELFEPPKEEQNETKI